jgi:hypothetical protein
VVELHQVATQLIVAVRQNELQVDQLLQLVVRALSAHIQSDQVEMMTGQVQIGQSVANGQASDQKQAMIDDQLVDQVLVLQAIDQVLAARQVAARVHVQLLIGQVPQDHAVMMTGQLQIGQSVVNGQASAPKQVMIADQLVDQVLEARVHAQIQVDRVHVQLQIGQVLQGRAVMMTGLLVSAVIVRAFLVMIGPVMIVPVAAGQIAPVAALLVKAMNDQLDTFPKSA